MPLDEAVFLAFLVQRERITLMYSAGKDVNALAFNKDVDTLALESRSDLNWSNTGFNNSEPESEKAMSAKKGSKGNGCATVFRAQKLVIYSQGMSQRHSRLAISNITAELPARTYNSSPPLLCLVRRL